MTALLRDYASKARYRTPKPDRPVTTVIYALLGLAGVLMVLLVATTSP